MVAVTFRPPPDIQLLCEELNGSRLVHLTQKRITESDLDRRQSRLRLPVSSENAIKALLSIARQAAGNFLPRTEMERMIEESFLQQEDLQSAMKLKGVDVRVFVVISGEARKEGQGMLKKWNCGSIVITTGNTGEASRAWDHLNKGDLVELWGFKDEENNLYFAIRKL